MACTVQSCQRKECRRRVPKSAMLQALGPLEAFDLFPEFRHGAGVEHLKLEPAHLAQDGAAPEFHQDGERGDLPQHDLGPFAFEGQLVLVADPFEVVGRQLQRLEPVHEFGREHLPLAVEGVAAHPGGLAPAEAQGADVVELFAQLPLVDEGGQRNARGAVDEGEGDIGVGPVAEHRLAHQELVEIRVDEGADDRVDLPLVVVDAGGDVDHGALRILPGEEFRPRGAGLV
jgi:hypothetical protein